MLISSCSNHSIGWLVASSLTVVGLIRVSTGPAIRVTLRGVAGWSSSAINATAASAWAQGWQTPIRCAPGPIAVRKSITWATYSSNPNAPSLSGASRGLSQSVM